MRTVSAPLTPENRPSHTPPRPSTSVRSSIAAGRGEKAARIAAIERLREFRAAHRQAKAWWIAGDRDAVFPAGTYWMRVHHNACVAPFD